MKKLNYDYCDLFVGIYCEVNSSGIFDREIGSVSLIKEPTGDIKYALVTLKSERVCYKKVMYNDVTIYICDGFITRILTTDTSDLNGLSSEVYSLDDFLNIIYVGRGLKSIMEGVRIAPIMRLQEVCVIDSVLDYFQDTSVVEVVSEYTSDSFLTSIVLRPDGADTSEADIRVLCSSGNIMTGEGEVPYLNGNKYCMKDYLLSKEYYADVELSSLKRDYSTAKYHILVINGNCCSSCAKSFRCGDASITNCAHYVPSKRVYELMMSDVTLGTLYNVEAAEGAIKAIAEREQDKAFKTLKHIASMESVPTLELSDILSKSNVDNEQANVYTKFPPIMESKKVDKCISAKDTIQHNWKTPSNGDPLLKNALAGINCKHACTLYIRDKEPIKGLTVNQVKDMQCDLWVDTIDIDVSSTGELIFNIFAYGNKKGNELMLEFDCWDDAEPCCCGDEEM